MSDAIQTTAAGATRVLFGTVAFICLMVGIEGMTGVEKISIGLSWLLIAAGAICAYAAFFWKQAKKVLSDEAQDAIAKFSRSGATKAALLLAVLVSIILSPFVEQHRWPFSYPIDASIIKERDDAVKEQTELANKLQEANPLANNWRFVSTLWLGSQTNAGPPECKFQIIYASRSTNAVMQFWQPLLRSSGWAAESLIQSDNTLPPGITIRSSANGTVSDRGSSSPVPSFQCASALQKAISDFYVYPHPPARLITNQSAAFIDKCPRECVEIDLDY